LDLKFKVLKVAVKQKFYFSYVMCVCTVLDADRRAGKGDETGPPRPIFKKLVYKYAIKLKMVGTLVRFCPKKA
jgi:hypothetical protein